ncbi:MAG TPA: hypothetical protein VH500_01855 [Nitrososphaeraceae archaeon]
MSRSSTHKLKVTLSSLTILLLTTTVTLFTSNSMLVKPLSPAFAQLPSNEDLSKAITPVTPIGPFSSDSRSSGSDAKDSFTINLKIRGIDYSDKLAQVWVTVNNYTSAYNINPIALLDPQDDGDGIIHVPVTFPHGVVKPGDEYTACIKILVHSDNLGDTYSCQKGIISAPVSSASILANGQSNQTKQEPFTVNLFL